jgi:hypothetical protein
VTLSIAIETDALPFGKVMETGLNDFVLRQNLVMDSIADLLCFGYQLYKDCLICSCRMASP